MRDVAIVGAAMTTFGKYLDRNLKSLAAEAVGGALDSAGMDKSQVDLAVVANSAAGLITGQEMIRGQVVLYPLGFRGIAIFNTENACASSSTALHQAWMAIGSGVYDTALVLGMEKLYLEDKERTFKAMGAGADVEGGDVGTEVAEGAGKKRTVFMDYYAAIARDHMERFGTTKADYAGIAAKNSYHGSLNPYAQYRQARTVEEVMGAPVVAEPLTRYMCSPIGDGAAAAVLVAADRAHEFTDKPVKIRASVVGSTVEALGDEPNSIETAGNAAYEQSGLGPEDLSLLEVHDATAPAELFAYEEMGLCKLGDGARLIRDGWTRLGGKQPVNVSGGLISRGHPVGATGAAQVCEVFWQLRGEAGKRQVKGARIGLTMNAGGNICGEPAAVSVHILSN